MLVKELAEEVDEDGKQAAYSNRKDTNNDLINVRASLQYLNGRSSFARF